MSLGGSTARENEKKPLTCVVVSCWTGRPIGSLYRLLNQMRFVESGVPFDLVVVCNGGDEHPLTLPDRFDSLRPRIFNRENSHFNLGAWDYGWRNAGDYEYFLFLQDDCFLKTGGWIRGFEFRMNMDPGIGLLGEMVKYDAMTWEFLRKTQYIDSLSSDPDRAGQKHPLDLYRSLLDKCGVPAGETGRHIPSIIMFTRHQVLREVGGFPLFGTSYHDAIGSEIAITKLIECHGYRVSKVFDYSFYLIGHAEWTETGIGRRSGWKSIASETWWKSKVFARRALRLKIKDKLPPMIDPELVPQY